MDTPAQIIIDGLRFAQPLIIITMIWNYFALLFFMREKKLGKRLYKIDLQNKAIKQLIFLTKGTVLLFIIGYILLPIWFTFLGVID